MDLWLQKLLDLDPEIEEIEDAFWQSASDAWEKSDWELLDRAWRIEKDFECQELNEMRDL